jgi:hypothetical protein
VVKKKGPLVRAFTRRFQEFLFDDDRFRGAVGRRILYCILKVGRYFGVNDLGGILSHLENLRDRIRAETAGGAQVRVDSYLHVSLLSVLISAALLPLSKGVP